MSNADCPGPSHPGGECAHGEEHSHEVHRSDREWLTPDADLRAESVRLSEQQWGELQGVGRVQHGDGALLDMGGGRIFFAPAGTPPPFGVTPTSALVPELPVAPHGTTVELRLFGMPYRWVRADLDGQYRLQRIETPPFYRELVRAHLDLASGNSAFRGMNPDG